MNYKKWLIATSQYYGVKEENILNTSRKPLFCAAKKTFYYLCFRDGINLYRLAEALGKHRTAVISCMYSTKNRNREAEKEIRTIVGANTIDDVIEYWLSMDSSRARNIVLTSLIAQKQLTNLRHETF